MLRLIILSFVFLGSGVFTVVYGAERIRFVAAAAGTQVVPPNNVVGSGTGYLTLNADNTVDLFGSFAGLTGLAVEAHLHIAPLGQPTTTISLNLSVHNNGGGQGTYSSTGTVTPFEASQIKVGRGVVDIHTAAFPLGEIRGQLAGPREIDYDGDGIQDLSNVRYTTFGLEPYTFIDRRSSTGAASYFGPLGISQRDTFGTGNFDGDGKADHVIYRDGETAGAQSFFYVVRSSDGIIQIKAFGTRGDQPTLGDYDGDGLTDFCIFRKGATQFSQANWWLEKSSVGSSTFFVIPFGTTGFQNLSGDAPVPADYDGDGLYDIAVFRYGPGLDPNNHFIIRPSSTGTVTYQEFGIKQTDLILPRCDFDGDQKADFAVARAGAAGTPMTWIYKESSTGVVRYIQWGTSTDVPVPGDYDGDGRTDTAVFRRGPPAQYWIFRSLNGTPYVVDWGLPSDTPVGHWFIK